MDPSADAPETAAAEPASAPAADLSIEQLLAEAEANQPAATATETPASDTEPKGDEPKPEAKPEEKPAEEPKVDEKAEAKDDTGFPERRARQILEAAHRKHAAAEKHTQTVIETFKRELRVDPSAALEKLTGYSLDQLIDISTGITPAERPAAKTETSERDKELDARLARIEAREQQAAYDAKAAEIKGAVAADAKAFPTINARGHQPMVIEFMEEYFREHGSPIAWKEAAKLVEADLAKFFGGAAPAAQAAKPAAAASGTPAAPAKPTTALTNGDVRTTAPVDEEPTDPDELIKYLTQKEEARLSRRVS